MKSTATRVFLILILFAISGVNCADQPPQPSSSFRRPLDMAIICLENGLVVSLDTCGTSATAQFFGYVSNGDLGDLAILNLSSAANIDADKFTPGFTRVRLGRFPTEIAPGPQDRFVYTINPISKTISRIDVLNFGVVEQKLTGHPHDIVIPRKDDGLGNVAYVSFSEDSALVIVPLDLFGLADPAAMEKIDLPNSSPGSMVLKVASKKLYVGHNRHNFVSVIDLENKSETTRIGLGPECADGIDNDGDGKIDQQDPGCLDSTDQSEKKPETGPYCTDGIDNDGDGKVDGDDTDCQDPSTWPQCSDGKDNDGDGKIDYSKDPAKNDPGCTSPFDNSEYSNNPQCSDGIDNDGDGKIDLDDPDCQTKNDKLEKQPTTACNDGKDNDGDGKIDLADPDCWGPDDNSETPAPANNCLDGIDNDRDGLIDSEDPDCQSDPKGEKLPQCSDHIDNDGDGLTDFPFAPGCKNADDKTETPECSDGIDNDGDGKIDYPDDPSCYAPGQENESVAPPEAKIRLALDPEGGFVYALHRGYRTVTVIDTVIDKQVDVNADILPGANVLLRRKGIKDIQLNRSPRDIVFVRNGDSIQALVATATGEAVYIEARVNGQWLHRLQDLSVEDVSTAIKPSLTINGKAIDLGFSRDPKYPSLGDLQVVVLDEETNQRRFYGLLFADDTRLQTTEFWSITYEGVIPGTANSRGRLLSSNGEVHFPTGKLCELGVKAGDLLVVSSRLNCGDFVGTNFQYEIAEVFDDRIVLKPQGGVILDDDFIVPDNPKTVPLPTVECFSTGALTFQVRANKEWTVVGSITGFLHEQTSLNGRCVVPSQPDQRFSSRAKEALVKPGETITTCPLPSDSDQVERSTFTNAIFSFDILPGCEPINEAETEFRVSKTQRGVTWIYTVNGAMTTKALIIGTLPRRLISDPNGGLIYAVDPAGDQIVRLNVTDDTLIIYR